MPHRLLAIVTDTLDGPEPAAEIRKCGDGAELELRVVIPAVEATPFRHTMGDVDEPREEAEERLEVVLAGLKEQGIEASGEVGDPDPVQAASDALLKAPADEVLIFEHEKDQAKWFEEGMFDRAKAGIEPPLRMVVLHGDSEGVEHVVEVEQTDAGTEDPDADTEIQNAYVPGLTRSDMVGIVMGIVGTIAAIILAAAISADSGDETGRAAVAILVAIGIALVNLAHVVGLTLMESVRYRGGFAKMFRNLSIFGTPLAVLVNLVLLLTQ
jgi:hypothetical protein